jgi:hypothetical protein
MKSLFIESDRQEIIDRINSVTTSSQTMWGKMNVTQVLAHCQVGIRGAYGELTFKRGLVGMLFGGMIKKSMTKDATPFKPGLPTDKAFIITGEKNFDEEKTKLIELVKQFSPAKIQAGPHPFFGKMTPKEWDILQWKHLDHHLRQVGA